MRATVAWGVLDGPAPHSDMTGAGEVADAASADLPRFRACSARPPTSLDFSRMQLCDCSATLRTECTVTVLRVARAALPGSVSSLDRRGRPHRASDGFHTRWTTQLKPWIR